MDILWGKSGRASFVFFLKSYKPFRTEYRDRNDITQPLCTNHTHAK